MASSYSPLKIELIATGEQTNAWGVTTNTNLGTALEEAIVGMADVNYFNDQDLVLTLINTNATQQARNFVLNVTSSLALTAQRELVVPAIEKPYIVINNTSGSQSILVKTAAGTGVAVPQGRRAFLYVDGVDVKQAFDFQPAFSATNLNANLASFTQLELPVNPLAVGFGGTGAGSAGGARTNLGLGTIATLNSPLPAANGGTGLTSPGASGNILTSNGTTWTSTTPAAVTPTRFSAGTTGFTPSTLTGPGDITLGGTLNVANGGTGATNQTNAQTNLNVPSRTGAGASGTWEINITGNAASATTATTATTAINVTNGLGVGQSWENLGPVATGGNNTRALNTNYTNATGKPIMVVVVSDSSQMFLSINNGPNIMVAINYSGGSGGMGQSLIIPDNTTYRITTNGTLQSWAELR
jgi:hypothetical protein